MLYPVLIPEAKSHSTIRPAAKGRAFTNPRLAGFRQVDPIWSGKMLSKAC